MLNRRLLLDSLRLGPWWYPIEQHLLERPHVIRHACCHRRGTRSPHLRRAAAIGWDRFGERLAKARVRQHEIVIDLEQSQLLPQARFAPAPGVDPASDRRDALAEVEVEPFNKSGVDGPAASHQDLFDG